MKRFGFGLLAAGLIAAATLLTTLPASAGHGGGMMGDSWGWGMGYGGFGVIVAIAVILVVVLIIKRK